MRKEFFGRYPETAALVEDMTKKGKLVMTAPLAKRETGGLTVTRSGEKFDGPAELKKLSIEELMEIDVTSVSKRTEKLSAAAAAITVITGDDIRRSGVTNLPDALRLATGLQVAQADGHK